MEARGTQASSQGLRRIDTKASVGQNVQSLARDIFLADPPTGFFVAAGAAASNAPTMGEIRRGSFGTEGWSAEGQVDHRRRTLSQSSRRKPSLGSQERSAVSPIEERTFSEPFASMPEEPVGSSNGHCLAMLDGTNAMGAVQGVAVTDHAVGIQGEEPDSSLNASERTDEDMGHKRPKAKRVYTSGYVPKATLPWTTSTLIGLAAFWKWLRTPFGFFLTLYGLNVVAWGGMLFLLLCNASKQMCWSPIDIEATSGKHSDAGSLALGSMYPRYYNCNDINSPRRVWLEICSQILNALFCVTGFGLAPWRFRDLYYLLRWRLTSESKCGREKKMYGLRILAGIHRNWFRLPGSQTLDELSGAEYERSLPTHRAGLPTELEAGLSEADASDLRLPLPLNKTPEPPLTGIRAPATTPWKMDFFVWSQVWNTFFQVALCGFMWGLDRYDRPSWSTGLFIAFACIIAAWGGWVSFKEGGKVKRVEGVRAKEVQDAETEMGVSRTATKEQSV